MTIHQYYIIIALLSIVATPQLVEAQTITAATAAPGAIPANVTTDIKFTATVTGRPLHVELTYLNGPAGHPIVVGQLRKKECRDHDDDRDSGDRDGDRGDNDHDRDCRNDAANDVYTLSKRFNLPVGQAQYQISAPGAQGQVVSPVLLVLSVTTPTGFTIDAGTLKLGGPLDFTNFNGQYLHGGFAPPGGAEIDIAHEPLPPPPLDNLIDIEIAREGAAISSRSPLTVSGISCTQVCYTNNNEGTSIKHQTIYCPSGRTLYKFFLSYYSSDKNETQYIASFQRVLAGVKFAP
jgi:hypothetical protein